MDDAVPSTPLTRLSNIADRLERAVVWIERLQRLLYPANANANRIGDVQVPQLLMELYNAANTARDVVFDHESDVMFSRIMDDIERNLPVPNILDANSVADDGDSPIPGTLEDIPHTPGSSDHDDIIIPETLESQTGRGNDNGSTNVTVNETQLSDMQFVPEEYYTLRHLKDGFSRKFNTSTSCYGVTFRNLVHIPIAEYAQHMEEIFAHILDKLMQNMAPHDYVRFHMHSINWRLDLNMPYMQASALVGTRILYELNKISQSRGDVRLDDGGIEINFVHTRMPDPGTGWNVLGSCQKRIFTCLQKWLDAKRCIIQIGNTDDMCLARAIVVAIAHNLKVTRGTPHDIQHFKYICRTDRPYQSHLATDLHSMAGVPLGPCGIAEVQKFQHALKPQGYRLYIYSATANFTPIFIGPETCDKRIAILHWNRHYDVITSMASMFNQSHFCWDCLKGIKSLETHRCENLCYNCRDVHCTRETVNNQREHCDQCNRYFSGPACLALHIRNGTCKTIQRCPACYLTIKKAKPHTCGKHVCRYCRKQVPQHHLCYIQKTKPKDAGRLEDINAGPSTSNNLGKRQLIDLGACSRKKSKTRAKPIIFYFDCEATQENGEHIANLIIVQNEDATIQKQFKGSGTIQNFGEWVFENHCDLQDHTQPMIFIAHYMKGYDGYFILKYLYEKHLFPEVIYTGNKIMCLVLATVNIKFIDSFNFLAMPLSKFPTTFGLSELKKGYFPHLFNTEVNQDYVGPIPPIELYQPDTKTEEERKKLMIWHAKHVADGYVFRMEKELVDYCISDVTILREGCESFRKLCIGLFRFDPFTEAITLAAYCQLVYRGHFMPEDTIAIIPNGNYAGHSKQSIKALKWLHWIAHDTGKHIIHAKNGGEVKIGGFYVDGFHRDTQTIYEFMGCFFHGCPKCYPPKTKNHVSYRTMGEVYAQTEDRLRILKDLGFNLVVMWECVFDRELKQNVAMATFVQQTEFEGPLNPRDAFYGGRTNPARLHYRVRAGETIRYYDFVSLYPTINKYGRMPVGHPNILCPPPEDYIPGKYFGLVKCKILPPKDLFHPVLPYKSHCRLLFPLCRTCAECRQLTTCTHTDAERAITGTWTTPELDMALTKQYVIITTFEIWHYEDFAEYDKTSKYPAGLFGGYVDSLLKIKQEASGWPTNIISQSAFIEDYHRKEGILLDKSAIELNPGLRTIAKLMLNSLWGKFGQREDLPSHEYVTTLARFMELLVSPQFIVSNVEFVNDETILVAYKTSAEFVVSTGRTNAVIAAFTTSLARLKLYGLLDILGTDVLYMDTDSVIFKSPDNLDPLQHLLGEHLGCVTNEIAADDNIVEFVSGGPKNYGYRCISGKETWKVCGISQNFSTRQKLSFDVIKSMVLATEEHLDEVIIIPGHEIVRNRILGSLYNRVTQKTYRKHFSKGVVSDDFIVYPYGFCK